MSSDKPKNNAGTPIESIEVKLRPIMGIAPRTYLPFAWSIFLALVVFLLLILPGIRRNGSYITVLSLPADTSVLVDGVRLGSSGESLFVEKGQHQITVRRPGFSDLLLDENVKGRIFASRLFPRKSEIHVELEPAQDKTILSDAVRNAALWAATGPERGRYALPPTLTLAARDLLSAEKSEEERKIAAEKMWDSALPLSTDERHIADLLRARMILDSGGAPPNPGNIAGLLQSLAESSRDTLRISEFALTLDESRITKLGWESLQAEGMAEWNALIDGAGESYRDARNKSITSVIGAQPYISFPPLSLPIGDLEAVANGYKPRSGASPVMAVTDSFSIAVREVSNADFQRFVRANLRWAAGQRKNLMAEGLVDSGYLASWIGDSYALGNDDYPIRDISWYAARAYCEWYSRTQLAGSGLIARLPREDEWEIAARLDYIDAENQSAEDSELQAVNRTSEGAIGIRGINGNVREWCETPFRNAENLYRDSDGRIRYQNPDDVLAAPQRVVRGISFIDSTVQYPQALRGALSPETTSPVIGFRMVIVPAGR